MLKSSAPKKLIVRNLGIRIIGGIVAKFGGRRYMPHDGGGFEKSRLQIFWGNGKTGSVPPEVRQVRRRETTGMRFFRFRHPYLIFAADFRDTSDGVTALHLLCDALNSSGESAYLLNTTLSKPGLNVRFLTDIDRWRHAISGVMPIVVYPEVVSENPYSAKAVVRYMLNHDGFLTGKKIQKQGSERTFYYSFEFVPEGVDSPDILQVPVLDDSLFSPPKAGTERVRSYLYIGRKKRTEIDFTQLPSDVEVLDMANPRSLTELASIFQSASVLYSYEISGTCGCALLAGCPVIYVRNPTLSKIPGQHDCSTDGAAFIDEIGGLERARATVARVRDHWQRVKDRFPAQLNNFINKTQAFADVINRIERRTLLERAIARLRNRYG